MSDPNQTTVEPSSGCVFRGLDVPCHQEGCAVCEPVNNQTRTFAGYTAEETATLCDALANAIERGFPASLSETAAIARRARDAIRFLLGEEIPEDA